MHPGIKLESLSETYHLGEHNRQALWSEGTAKLLHRGEPTGHLFGVGALPASGLREWRLDPAPAAALSA